MVAGLVSAGDLAQMQADLAAVRGDREETITIRRGATTLDGQAVRIARAGGSGSVRESGEAQESGSRVVVMGGVDLDIEPGDRFNDAGGVLYQVVLVRPNRAASVVAEAEVVE